MTPYFFVVVPYITKIVKPEINVCWYTSNSWMCAWACHLCLLEWMCNLTRLTENSAKSKVGVSNSETTWYVSKIKQINILWISKSSFLCQRKELQITSYL